MAWRSTSIYVSPHSGWSYAITVLTVRHVSFSPTPLSYPWTWMGMSKSWMRRAVLVPTVQVSAWLSSWERHSVWLVAAVRAPILVVRMADTTRGAVIQWRAANQRLGTCPLCPSIQNSQFLLRSRALFVRLYLCIFALFIRSYLSFLSVSGIGLVLFVSLVCEAKSKTIAAIELFDNSIFNFFPPPLGVRP